MKAFSLLVTREKPDVTSVLSATRQAGRGLRVSRLSRSVGLAVVRLILGASALAPASAQAQQVGGVLTPPIPGPGSGSLYPTPIPPQQGGISGMHGIPGFHPNPGSRGHFRRGFNGGVIFVEPEYVPVVVEQAAQDEPAAPPAPAPPPEPRKPYVIGRSYDSLPGGCLKLLQDGASYFQCNGRWYQEVGDEQYKAVRMP